MMLSHVCMGAASRMLVWACSPKPRLSAAIVMLSLSLSPLPALATLVGLHHIATGVHAPTAMAAAPGDPDRLFVLSKLGEVKILNLKSGQFEPTPFLTVPDVDYMGEAGLVGIAFHPDYQNNGKFYLHTTVDNGGVLIDGAPSPLSSQVREYTVSANPNIANTSYDTVLEIVRPNWNHVGGWIGFSPKDGYLYVASGDGGHANDFGPGHTPLIGNAQDVTNNLMGKMLRIDVNGDDFPDDPARNYAIPPTNPFADRPASEGGGSVIVEGDDEIWAFGLRNPYRASFDRATGDLWIADVGQQSREEINFQPANSPGGENYGWRVREGDVPTPGVTDPVPPNLVDPVYVYSHTVEQPGGAVIGGFVYRGPDPRLQGRYIFADGDRSEYWMIDSNDIPTRPGDPPVSAALLNSVLTPDEGQAIYPTSFGEDASGNLYVSYYFTHNVYRLVTDQFKAGDFNGDAVVDGQDIQAWAQNFGMQADAGNEHGDAHRDGRVDGADFLAWQRNVGWSPLNVATTTATAVPEPAATTFIIVAVLTYIARPSWPGARAARGSAL